MTEMRVRVRPLSKATNEQVAGAWSNRLCLSTPHLGEAVDFATDPYRMRKAVEAKQGATILHFEHSLGIRCQSAESQEREIGARCLILDYVPKSQARTEDEDQVGGVVAAVVAKAGGGG